MGAVHQKDRQERMRGLASIEKILDNQDKKLATGDTDSKTSDVSEEIRVTEHDDRITMRINSGLKRVIIRHCRAKGLSTCHINDALWVGYLRGWNEKIELDVKSPTINLSVVRDVKRPRRYFVEEEETEEFSHDGLELCHYCRKRGISRVAVDRFRYVPTGKVYPLCQMHAEELLITTAWELSKEETKASLPERNKVLDKDSATLRKELQGFMNFSET